MQRSPSSVIGQIQIGGIGRNIRPNFHCVAACGILMDRPVFAMRRGKKKTPAARNQQR